MNKSEYIEALKDMLTDFPADETERFLLYYSEMIDDRVDDGMTEEEACLSIGDIEAAAKQIKSEMPMSAIVKSNVKAKVENERERRGGIGWLVVLAVVGFPIWFPLALALLMIVFALLICIWSLVLSLWVIFASFAASAVLLIPSAVYAAVYSGIGPCLLYIGTALVCVGISIVFFWLSLSATKWTAKGCAACFKRIKRSLVK